MPKFSDDEVFEEIGRRQREQWNTAFSDKMLKFDMAQARKSASRFKGHSHEVLGEHLGSIPHKWYNFLNQRYPGWNQDEDFIRWFVKNVLRPEGMSHAKV